MWCGHYPFQPLNKALRFKKSWLPLLSSVMLLQPFALLQRCQVVQPNCPSINNGFECISHSDAGCMPMKQDSPSVVQHAASQIRCITARRPPVTATCSTHCLPEAISVHSTAVLRDLPHAIAFIWLLQLCLRTGSPVRSQPTENDCGLFTLPTQTCQGHLFLFNN